jgi:hypothetical protein
MLVDALGPWAITLEAQVQNLGLLHLVRGGGSPLNRRAQKSRARSTEPTKKTPSSVMSSIKSPLNQMKKSPLITLPCAVLLASHLQTADASMARWNECFVS